VTNARPSARWKKLVGWLAVLLLVGVMLRWLENHLVFVPSRRLEASAADLRRPFQDVHFTTRDGVRLHGWFFPAKEQSLRAHLVFLLLHGNAGNISHRLDFYDAWLELGVNVFAFDYRGYGRSEGRPSEEGTYRDAEAACHWLEEKGFKTANILAVGESLGGGVASELALRVPVGGVILQNSFTSMTDIGCELYPWLPVRTLGRIKYDTRAKLPRLKAPVLVAHSRGDTFIRFHHAERNLAAASEPKMFWELDGDHSGTVAMGRRRYLEGLEKFLAAYFK
jgi:hypothetical protein